MTFLRRYWPQALLLTLAILLVFGQSCLFEFVTWDDANLIYKNEYVRILSWQRLGGAWLAPHSHLYIPVTYNLWALLGAISQAQTPDPNGITLNPWIFHIVNVLVHLANALLVYLILQLLLKRPWIALSCAILWAIHPLQVESVAWATGMKDLLSGFFSLAALLFYLYAAIPKKQLPSIPSNRRCRSFYLLALLFMFIATLAKPGVVGVPVMALVLDWLWLDRPLRKGLLTVIPLFLAVLPASCWTAMVQPAANLYSLPLWTRPLIAGHSLATYLQKLCWPDRLTFDYGLTPGHVLSHVWGHWAWLVPYALSMAILLYHRGRKQLGACWLIFLAGVAPVTGLVPFIFQYYSTIADRYMYLSLLGAALAGGWTLARLPRQWAIVSSLAILLAFSARSFLQAQTWENSQALYDHAIEVNPRTFVAYTNLASLLIQEARQIRSSVQGANPADPQVKQAFQHATDLDNQAEKYLLTSLQNAPRHVMTLNDLATIYTQRGDYETALDYLEQAVAALDTMPPALIDQAADRKTVGQICLQLGKYDRAVFHFQRFLQLHPENAEVRALLAQATAALERTRQSTTAPGVKP